MSVELKTPVDLDAPAWTRPTRLSGAVFVAKVTAFRARRVLADLADAPPRLSRNPASSLDVLVAESSTPLWSDATPQERTYELGKVENLRLACRALDGLVIPVGAAFSFWRHVGPPTGARGYVAGRMLQEGCMVAAIGGGLCQLSNALYDAALRAGCRIIERHAHSRIVPGSAAAFGRDATVAWNYVDLRFAPEQALRISATLDGERLTVRLWGASPIQRRGRGATPRTPTPTRTPAPVLRTCATCEETDCHRHEPMRPAPAAQAFLVDEAWPEFRRYVAAVREPRDRLARPFGGRLGRYDWNLDGFDRVGAAPVAAARRSLAVRAAGRSGAAARRAELACAERLARALGAQLTYDVEAVTVAQSYLPFLWRDGRLGGRKVTVLMTSLPLAEIEARLDAAAARRPGCASLSDFRAPSEVVEAEQAALAACARIITPHADIAALFPDRAVKLPWSVPPPGPRAASGNIGRIGFPGPTAARKGAHAVREAALALDLKVAPMGAELEGEGFWRGVRLAPPGDWTAADVMVQPAVVEHQPRRLLAALAAGRPVIATAACGLDPQPGLTLIPPDDTAALIAALRAVLDAG